MFFFPKIADLQALNGLIRRAKRSQKKRVSSDFVRFWSGFCGRFLGLSTFYFPLDPGYGSCHSVPYPIDAPEGDGSGRLKRPGLFYIKAAAIRTQQDKAESGSLGPINHRLHSFIQHIQNPDAHFSPGQPALLTPHFCTCLICDLTPGFY